VTLATLETRARDRMGEPLVHPAINVVLGALDGAGVRWCLLRGESRLAVLGGDVELLVDARDLDSLHEALAAVGGFVPLPSAGHGPHRLYASYEAGADAWLKLDVVTELAFGRYQELPTHTAEAILARRRRFGGIVLPDPSDGFWGQLLHLLLDRPRVRSQQAREVAAAARGAWGRSSPLSIVVDAACPSGWDARRVLDAASAHRWDELHLVAIAMRQRWPGATPAAQRLHRDASRVLRRLGGIPGDRVRGPGVILAGADSALRREIADGLQTSWPSRACVLRPDPDDMVLSRRERRLRAARRRLTWHAGRARGDLVVLDGSDVLGRGQPRGRAAADVVVSLCPDSGLSLRLPAPHTVELDAGLSIGALRRVVTEIAWSSWAERTMPEGRSPAFAREPR
jgi:hypothetical protein